MFLCAAAALSKIAGYENTRIGPMSDGLSTEPILCYPWFTFLFAIAVITWNGNTFEYFFIYFFWTCTPMHQ